ncbi:MAG: ECF transporter S component [Selenomonadaceae bacterium]|nr:ECF transporter S component [Selenomonadaceae bacterium]
MNTNIISTPKDFSHQTKWTTQTMCLAAVMTTLVFLTTFVPRIPIPLGYAHLGDATIFLLVLFLPHRPAFLAACLGSALSDLLGGFPLWILPTLLIKFVMAWLTWKFNGGAVSLLRTAAAFFLASLWMAVGYTIFGVLLYNSLSAGLASAPGLFLEGIINTIVALLLLPILNRALQH